MLNVFSEKVQWKNLEKKVDSVLKDQSVQTAFFSNIDLIASAESRTLNRGLPYRHSLIVVLSTLSSVQNSNTPSLHPKRQEVINFVSQHLNEMKEALLGQYEAMIASQEKTLKKRGALKELQSVLETVRKENDLEKVIVKVNEQMDKYF